MKWQRLVSFKNRLKQAKGGVMDKRLDSFAHPQIQKNFVDGIGKFFAADVPFCFYVVCFPREMKDGFVLYEFMPIGVGIPISFYYVVN